MPGHKTWAIGEEVISTDFNPIIADQIVATYASAAARTSGWPSPPVGAVSHLADSPGVLWVWNGTTWIREGARGQLGYAENLTGLTNFGPAWVDIPGLTLSGIVFPANRRTQFVAAAHMDHTTGGQAIGMQIIDELGATLDNSTHTHFAGSLAPELVRCERILTPVAGSHNYRVQAIATGTGTGGRVIASSVQPAWLLVNDLGSSV
jgi:hypothetical protein